MPNLKAIGCDGHVYYGQPSKNIMKITLQLSLFLFFAIFSSYGQVIEKGYSKYKGTYLHQFKPFDNDTTVYDCEYFLIFNDKFSSFDNKAHFEFSEEVDKLYSKNSKESESVYSMLNSKNKLPAEAAFNNFTITKEYSTKNAIYVYNLGYISNCNFNENYGLLEWSVKSDSKNINGYNCILATTKYGKYELEAWFTPEIPVSDGPYLFGGLPGLIVSLRDTENIHVFTLTEFTEESTILLKDVATDRQGLHPNKPNQAMNKMKKLRQQLISGYDISKSNILYPSQKLPRLEDASDDNIKRLMLKFTLYDHLLFKYSKQNKVF